MISNEKIVQWRDTLKETVFNVFNTKGDVKNSVIIAKVDEDGTVLSTVLDTSEVPAEYMRSSIQAVINNTRPDAYVICGRRKIILFDEKDTEEMYARVREAGSVANLEDAIEVMIFVYETKAITNIELYEIIREGDEAVLSKIPMAESTRVESEMFFTGMLRDYLHNSISEFNLN
jgi:hypothetical protein